MSLGLAWALYEGVPVSTPWCGPWVRRSAARSSRASSRTARARWSPPGREFRAAPRVTPEPLHTPQATEDRSEHRTDARRDPERIVAATLQVFAERGLDGTVPEVAALEDRTAEALAEPDAGRPPTGSSPTSSTSSSPPSSSA
ncbi:hypothetical protein ACKI1Y_01435 [Streptomyces acidiscabies]